MKKYYCSIASDRNVQSETATNLMLNSYSFSQWA